MGGEAGIRHLVDRFYQYMDSEARYAEIRAMHAQDLGPVREYFSQYLISWMGGPLRRCAVRPRRCGAAQTNADATTGGDYPDAGSQNSHGLIGFSRCGWWFSPAARYNR